jgi:hypothetical protein
MQGKSLTDLRGIAQGYGVVDVFKMTEAELRQAISLKQQDMQPKPKIEIPKPEYDARLMTKPPGKKSDRQLAEEMLAPYVARGLVVTFPTPEEWHMRMGKKEDTGTVRMPIRTLLSCADRMMK